MSMTGLTRLTLSLVAFGIVACTASVREPAVPISDATETELCATIDRDGVLLSAATLGALYCMDLVAIPELADAQGVIELRSAASPTPPALTIDGAAIHQPVARITGLPPVSTFPGAGAYVAWATTLSMDTLIRLGTVQNGRSELRAISLDQFRILVSAEPNEDALTRSGRIVLRGTSPSTRLLAHRDMLRAGPLGFSIAPSSATTEHVHEGSRWRMPPMDPRQPMMAGMEGMEPSAAPFLPTVTDTAAIPLARPRELVELRSGDTLRLEAAALRRRIAGKEFLMYGFNGQHPGPLIRVAQNATIYVDFINRTDLPSTVHWHGVRLSNRNDGVPHLTQELVQPGGRFRYEIHFPDAGIYWYHPHHREDVQQELGLYGNLLVDPSVEQYYGPANREEVLMLDDLLLDERGLVPFGGETPTHALMGRFGNVFLINGEPGYRLSAKRAEVVRLFLTNVSNARVYNLSIPGARLKLVASDVGRFEREEWVENIVIAPAERYVVDVRFDRAGPHPVTNRVRALNHASGTYFAEIDTLGTIDVAAEPIAPDHALAFERLRTNDDVSRDIGRYRAHFNRAADYELTLGMRVQNLHPSIAAMASGFPVPVDWNDGMSMMNWAATGNEIAWTLRDSRTGRENMDVRWTFRVGDVVRLRVFNDPAVFHAMDHPIHVHGQRVLVLSRNGVAPTNRVWKDTALIAAGETVELLIELSNPGKWMLHCHIAEHLGSGMMMAFEVLQ